MADCWRPEQRGHSFAIATFLPLLGPALGPIIGGFISNSIGWRWIFWVLSIFDGCLLISAFFFFPETYEQLLLHRKAKKLRKQTGKPYHTKWEDATMSLKTKLGNSLTRPMRLLATQPTIQLMSIFLAYNFGILYLVLSTFATLWIDRYHQGPDDSGLHYIALVIGYTIAAQGGARVMDRLWAHLKRKANGKTAPEYRVPLMLPGVFLIPAGLFWYGWSAEAIAPWIVTDLGIAVFGMGVIVSTQSMQAYVMDSYSQYVASASAASQFLRSIFGFAFPIFAPSLYRTLGYGWGNSLLAFLFLALGIPAPIILWKYGARLRAKGKPLW
jgi:MFS family permease